MILQPLLFQSLSCSYVNKSYSKMPVTFLPLVSGSRNAIKGVGIFSRTRGKLRLTKMSNPPNIGLKSRIDGVLLVLFS